MEKTMILKTESSVYRVFVYVMPYVGIPVQYEKFQWGKKHYSCIITKTYNHDSIYCNAGVEMQSDVKLTGHYYFDNIRYNSLIKSGHKSGTSYLQIRSTSQPPF